MQRQQRQHRRQRAQARTRTRGDTRQRPADRLGAARPPKHLREHLRERRPEHLPRRHPSAERALDLALGSVLLILAAPALAAGALALAVRRPPGGIIERSPRVGQGGRVFVLRSLRTRRLRLDVLSRLPHVVRGDLSLVGPEPLAPGDPRTHPAGPTDPDSPGAPCGPAAPIAASIARDWRKELKPGLTGLAQIRSGSGMPWDEPALLDQHYAEHRGPGLDLAILARAARIALLRALRGIARPGKAHLSDTDHRRCGYIAAE
ncbi:sugar transferase [Streptomyces sp. NPDC052042]|uniref:sugar transferase n=1 Tax=Streptomyces sp. NPDC052042 TaxID=3365683 RepID=UPI0037D1516A